MGYVVLMVPLLDAHNIGKIFGNGESALKVVSNVSFSVSAGETLALVGPSGSGKTTLLGICAGLDRPSEGTVTFAGRNLATLSDDELCQVRRNEMGFVFQNFQLISSLSALENVRLSLELHRQTCSLKKSELDNRAAALLESVGLQDRATHYPSQLSGGEQQRVALARAFVHQPRILFADEPTGNLDLETSSHVAELLFNLNRQFNTTLILVTHNASLAAQTGRVIALRGGRVTGE